MKLSYSGISTYLECPLQYKLIYKDRLKIPAKPYFSFGSSLHKAAEFFYSAMLATPPTLDELLKYYEENWESEGFESEEDERKHFETGIEILKKFHEINSKDYKIPLAVEQSFNVDLNGIVLTGIIDRVDKLPSGNLEIIDYKSGKKFPTIEELNENLQLSIYHIAAEKTWGIFPEKLTIYHLRSNTPLSSQRTPEQVRKTMELMLDVSNEIDKGNFDPELHLFCPCDFPQHCPYFSHKYKIEKPSQMVLGEKNIPKAVKDYVQTKEEIKELNAKVKEIEEAIIKYCEDNNLRRVYSDEYFITFSRVERKGYEEKEIERLLKEKDLWQNVLSFDSKKVKNLLEDPNMSYELRKEIKSLEKVISAYNQLRYSKLKEKKEN
jgi:RecB family exonuclease